MKNSRIPFVTTKPRKTASGNKTTWKIPTAFALACSMHLASATAAFGQWIESAAHEMYFLEGFVGIGTSDPSRLLHLRVSNNISSTTGQLYVQQLSTGDAFMQFGLGAGRHYALGIDNSDGDCFKIGTGGNSSIGVHSGTLFRITPAGNVSIGTNSALYRLNVNGTVRATEVRVETGWADYVFDEDYRLRPLTEVEQFIREHRHLPGVTPAAEIQKDGLQVSKQMTEMMEKIEELTLYILELNKRLEQLERENAALKGK